MQLANPAHPRTTHGYAHRIPEYEVWRTMNARCSNPRNRQFADYGGRGIVVCEEWRRSFAAFLRDMGRRPSPAHSIDRINNDGPYEQGNCRWATLEEQQNNKRNNVLVTRDGRTMSLRAWARTLGLKYKAVHLRVSRGMSPLDALLTPFRRSPLRSTAS